jgi:Dual specificity phosphatase, catalytic domain
MVAVWVGPRTKSPALRQFVDMHAPSSSPSRRSGSEFGGRSNGSVPTPASGRRMDITWLTDRIAVGGGIWNSENMEKVAREGITHVIDMQIEFDDTPLGLEHGVEVLWNPTDDDFTSKPAELFRKGVNFAMEALEKPEAKLFIHCAAGVHRAPMMTLAVLRSMGWGLGDAMRMIQARRPVVDFADVYVESVERFLNHRLG